jgi:hypothetical protein
MSTEPNNAPVTNAHRAIAVSHKYCNCDELAQLLANFERDAVAAQVAVLREALGIGYRWAVADVDDQWTGVSDAFKGDMQVCRTALASTPESASAELAALRAALCAIVENGRSASNEMLFNARKALNP